MDRELAQRHPNVTVERDPIYVLDRGVYTSAGSTAALDLVLALVEDDLGQGGLRRRCPRPGPTDDLSGLPIEDRDEAPSRGRLPRVRVFDEAIMNDANRALERSQLDLFLDGQDVLLVSAIVANLLGRHPDRVQDALTRLKEENPGHPDLATFDRLCRALRTTPPRPTTDPELRALIESMKSLGPMADRLLGDGARAFLLPWWQAIAHAGAMLPAAEVEPPLRYWLGFARHHLGEEREALRLWLALCWLAPDAFAQWAPTLPSVILRDAWTAFQAYGGHHDRRDGSPWEVLWFPAWLALQRRWVAQLFHAEEIPDTEAPLQALRLLRTLLPLESQGYSAELIRHRRRLQQISPTFFRAYLEVVVEVRRNS